MKFVVALIALTGVHAACSFAADQPAAAKADPAQAQQIVTKVCSACHGADGNSVSPANPSLAGQHAEYLAKQLSNFKSGARKNPVMSTMAAPLSDQDIKGLAAYFQGQKPKNHTAKDPALVALGQKIYRGGIAAKGVAACAACHGPSGAGIPAQFPRLAGQYSDYTTAQLQAFRSHDRNNDPNAMMETIASRLSDQEIKAVAEYVAGLR